MCFAWRPAYSYCWFCPPASTNWSGITIGRTLREPWSRRPPMARKWSTCSPKPPIAPSSTVISTSCSAASFRMRSSSSGFMNRASATVTPMSESGSEASMRCALTASTSRVPSDRIATLCFLSLGALRMMRPTPTGSGETCSGLGTSVRSYPKSLFSASAPYPFPRGYRTADGLSSIMYEVLIMRMSSISSAGAMITMSGRVPR
mmetsp:Transcript_39621/g.93822  ORF Transcript_39621/g.93822 Transcript_39621/m.93822 type:complete len:204 (+) Transcript_39621:190-801(+)